MPVSLTSSLPRAIIRGFRDISSQPASLEEEALPIHLPLFPLLTEWGPVDDALLVGGNGFKSFYGSKSLEVSSPYFTHQSELAKRVLGNANLSFVRRLVPADAASARLRLSLEVVADDLPIYQRNVDGTYFRDANGALVTEVGTVQGYKLRWRLDPITSILGVDQFAIGTSAAGDLVGEVGAVSTVYPILDLETRFPGAKGNNLGLRLMAPTLLSAEPTDIDLIDQMGAFIYRFWAVERSDALSSASIVKTMQSEQYVPFTFKAGTADVSANLEYGIDDVLLQAYESSNPEEFNGFGPFKRIHVYQANLQTILEDLYLAEESYDTITATLTPEQTINVVNGVSASGVPYHAIQVLGPADGGLLLTEASNHWAVGGSDGTLSEAVYDQLVQDELNNFVDGTVPYMDSAKYPFSTMYDTGFEMDTKYSFINVLNRKDVWVNIATQVASEPLNTPSIESSRAVALRAHFRTAAESDYWGTPATRVVLVGNAGQLIGTRYKKPLPFLIALAEKASLYMGAATGYLRSVYAFDIAPHNVVSSFVNHNAVFRSEEVRNRDWNNGLVFAQNYDRKSIFWAGLQTIYDDPTSILNSYFNMVILCNVTRVGERAWRNYTNDSKLSNDQFLARVERYVTEQTNGRYDGRMDIVPNAYFTGGDIQRGYSWNLDITGRGQGIKTVETLTVIAERREVTADGTA